MRFEKLMEHFKNEDDNIDFLVCGLPPTIPSENVDAVSDTVRVLSGGLYAVHQHRGPLCGGHELSSPSAVRLHQAQP